LGRVVMLSHVAEQVTCPGGRQVEIGGREPAGEGTDVHGTGYLVEFRLESGLPVWRYDVEGVVLEKRLFLAHMQNTVYITYELVTGPDHLEVALRPSVNFRAQESPVSEPLGWPYEFRSIADRYEIALKDSNLPPLRLLVHGEETTFTLKGKRFEHVLYP